MGVPHFSRANLGIVVRAAPSLPRTVTESFAATATELSGDERTRAFDAMCTAMPRFGDYQASVEREIPVIRLRRSE